MNFLKSPIWGLTGRLSLRQRDDAQSAKDARLAAAGQIDTGPPKHVLEGHADRRDLLGWATDVTSRARRGRKEVLEELGMEVSKLRRVGVEEYWGVHGGREGEGEKGKEGGEEEVGDAIETGSGRGETERGGEEKDGDEGVVGDDGEKAAFVGGEGETSKGGEMTDDGNKASFVVGENESCERLETTDDSNKAPFVDDENHPTKSESETPLRIGSAEWRAFLRCDDSDSSDDEDDITSTPGLPTVVLKPSVPDIPEKSKSRSQSPPTDTSEPQPHSQATTTSPSARGSDDISPKTLPLDPPPSGEATPRAPLSPKEDVGTRAGGV